MWIMPFLSTHKTGSQSMIQSSDMVYSLVASYPPRFIRVTQEQISGHPLRAFKLSMIQTNNVFRPADSIKRQQVSRCVCVGGKPHFASPSGLFFLCFIK